MNDQTVDPADADLLRRLGAIAESVDPAPELVRELGRAALSFRRPDSELADLVADSAEQPATVRAGAAGDRLLSFDADQVTIELQVSPLGGSRMLLGQLLGQEPDQELPDGVARIEAASGVLSSTGVDQLGRFAFDQVPDGLTRVRVVVPGAVDVVTPWVRFEG